MNYVIFYKSTISKKKNLKLSYMLSKKSKEYIKLFFKCMGFVCMEVDVDTVIHISPN